MAASLLPLHAPAPPIDGATASLQSPTATSAQGAGTRCAEAVAADAVPLPPASPADQPLALPTASLQLDRAAHQGGSLQHAPSKAPVAGSRHRGVVSANSTDASRDARPALPSVSKLPWTAARQPSDAFVAQDAPSALSFAQAVTQPFSPPSLGLEIHTPAFTDGGEPAAFFSLEEIRISCKPLLHSIIAKTPRGRPPFQDIRNHLQQRFALRQEFLLCALGNRHLLIQFHNRDDFLQVLLKGAMLIHGRPFRFHAWSIEFSPDTDSPVVPVWLELPGLPVNFYNDALL